MVPWNALPLHTIGIIIALSIIIPVLLSLLLIKIKKYEELGWVIGIFLVILSILTYSIIIPFSIVDNARIPDDYIWEDEGKVYYWERNTVLFPDEIEIRLFSAIANTIVKRDPIKMEFIGKEVIHVTKFNKYENTAIIHDAIYDENGEIFRVLNGKEAVSEWYEINTKINSLKYVNVEAGHMGIPSNLEGTNVIRVGWVDSGGRKEGSENVVLVREMKKIKSGELDGLKLDVWQSDVNNVPIIWHGESYICDETLRLTVNPQTGYIINVYRHLVLSARMSQFLKMYYPDLMQNRLFSRFLKIYDPIGEGAELIYETTQESQARHINEAKGLVAQMTYLPVLICVPLFIIGILLVWRYSGRSYYWKRYGEFEQKTAYISRSENNELKKYYGYKKSKKIIAIFIGFILIFTSITIIIQNVTTSDSGWFLFNDSKPLIEDIPPSPPGSNRAIDSGRHILTPEDEGPHDSGIRKLAQREWWYFNVFFNGPDSDLKDWSMIVSFNKMAFNDIRFLKRDNLFLVLYDDKGNNYDFNIFNQVRGTLKYSGPGVDVSFKSSWAKGVYPNWQVHAENPEKDFYVDLKYTADFLPIWVAGRSSNLLFARGMAGDYYNARCIVEGTIRWEGKEYTVNGIGYHDHVWEVNIPRFVSKGWDWFNIHFDNGWEMYISKFIFRGLGDKHVGVLILSPDNRNIVEWIDFKIDYIETKRATNLPLMYYPTKYRITVDDKDMNLDLELTFDNVCEITWRLGRTGMFEGPCKAKGYFTWDGYTVNLNGYGFAEITRVKYLLSGFGILENLRERLSTILNR